MENFIHTKSLNIGSKNTAAFYPPENNIFFATTSDTNNATNNNTNTVTQELQFNQTGRLIVDTLGGLELHEFIGDKHSSAVQRLIVAAVVIALISAMLVATVILFRCYMLYCQDHLNIRHYQRPPINEKQKDEESKHCGLSLLNQKNLKEEKCLFNPIKKTTTTTPTNFENNKEKNLKNENGVKRYYNNNHKCITNKYSFKNIFDDD
ncbi:hypothetical protein ACQ4LE_010325 [Meloidogyne hapla]|uniref:Uncharacterized protein n=1 Tax=Meloidogyne hapla TaxID=6305 RepID=A0A1I8BRT7_MELHA